MRIDVRSVLIKVPGLPAQGPYVDEKLATQPAGLAPLDPDARDAGALRRGASQFETWRRSLRWTFLPWGREEPLVHVARRWGPPTILQLRLSWRTAHWMGESDARASPHGPVRIWVPRAYRRHGSHARVDGDRSERIIHFCDGGRPVGRNGVRPMPTTRRLDRRQ